MGETKEVAKKYFPELFDEDDHLLFNRASILKDIYTLHFSNRSGNFSNSEINLINNGYNYIENAKKMYFMNPQVIIKIKHLIILQRK